MGMVAVQVYAKDIFAKAAPSLSSHFCSVMFAVVLLLGCLLSAVFTDRFGRKVSEFKYFIDFLHYLYLKYVERTKL